MFQVNNQSFSADNINCEMKLFRDVPVGISRREIDGAVCMDMYDMSAFKKGMMAFGEQSIAKIVSVKACTCASGSCPSHSDAEVPNPEPERRRYSARPRKGSATSITRSRPQTSLPKAEEMKLSLTSLSNTSCTTAIERKDSEQFKKWLSEKNESKRRLEHERQLLEEAVLREKQKKLETERRNFSCWLAAKKAEEQRRKLALNQQEHKEKCEELDKDKKQLENELNYQLWRKRKEEEYLENKLKEQVAKLRAAEDRKRRIQLNAAAYEEWLKNSRYKPRPLPMNRGLDSLRASVSVSYVNPTPWEPNITLEYPLTH